MRILCTLERAIEKIFTSFLILVYNVMYNENKHFNIAWR